MFRRLFSARGGSTIRFGVRAAVACATAFGLDLTADQVAAVQLAVEAILQIGVLMVGDETTPEG